jgi:hypothetical protein
VRGGGEKGGKEGGEPKVAEAGARAVELFGPKRLVDLIIGRLFLLLCLLLVFWVLLRISGGLFLGAPL